jgi:hypothetical protein
MAEFIAAVSRIERDEHVRLIALWAFTALLAVAFLALLVGDQVRAASF